MLPTQETTLFKSECSICSLSLLCFCLQLVPRTDLREPVYDEMTKVYSNVCEYVYLEICITSKKYNFAKIIANKKKIRFKYFNSCAQQLLDRHEPKSGYDLSCDMIILNEISFINIFDTEKQMIVSTYRISNYLQMLIITNLIIINYF